MLTPTIDYIVTLGLGIILALKYVFFDGEIDVEHELQKKEQAKKKKAGDSSCCCMQEGEWFRGRAQTMPSGVRPHLSHLIDTVNEQSMDAGTMSATSVKAPTLPVEPQVRRRKPRLDLAASFTIGDSDDSDVEAVPTCSEPYKVATMSVETQTPSRMENSTYSGPVRSLEDCIRIMKSDVSDVLHVRIACKVFIDNSSQ